MEQKYLKILSKGFIFKHRKKSLCQTSKFFCVMKTRVLFLMLLSAVVVSLSSCTHTEKRAVPGTENWDTPDYYVLKTKDNKTLWGLQISSPSQNGKTGGNLVLQCEWDQIKTYEANGGRFYLAQKGSLWYLFDSFGRALFEKKGFSSINYLGADLPLLGKSTNQYYITAPEGVYGAFISIGAKYFGPYEDYWGGVRGYFFKENGKWGFKLAEAKTTDDGKGESSLLITPQYDALVEIYDRSVLRNNSVFIAKQGNKWIALDSKGKPVKASAQKLANVYNNTPSRNKLSMRSAVGVDASTFKNSSAEVGILFYHPIPW